MKKKTKTYNTFEEAKKAVKKLAKKIHPEDTYSVDMTICAFAAPRVRAYRHEVEHKKISCGDLTHEEWIEILKKIEEFLTFGSCDESCLMNEEQQKKYDNGLKLFKKYFQTMWW
jgi:hypothetical protein